MCVSVRMFTPGEQTRCTFHATRAQPAVIAKALASRWAWAFAIFVGQPTPARTQSPAARFQ
eukprot:855114-Pleurochrysis_carterae.AAC.2